MNLKNNNKKIQNSYKKNFKMKNMMNNIIFNIKNKK